MNAYNRENDPNAAVRGMSWGEKQKYVYWGVDPDLLDDRVTTIPDVETVMQSAHRPLSTETAAVVMRATEHVPNPASEAVQRSFEVR